MSSTVTMYAGNSRITVFAVRLISSPRSRAAATTAVVAAALERGLLINRTANTVIRLLPAYIVTVEEIDEALSLLDAAIIAASL